jgi:hypothetical protein
MWSVPESKKLSTWKHTRYHGINAVDEVIRMATITTLEGSNLKLLGKTGCSDQGRRLEVGGKNAARGAKPD